MAIEKYISPLIASQFPSFYKDEGPNFIAFVKAYYEWMEQSGQVINHSRSLLDYIDIDRTQESFIKYFKNSFVSEIPNNIATDKRLLIKHIIELYQSKGTKRAYALLFRLVFNEDIDIYLPGENLFKSSAATWYTPQYIEVSDNQYLPYLNGKKIYSVSAHALVESHFTKKVNNKLVNVLYISNLEGNFKFGEKIFCDDLYVNNESGEVIDYHQYSMLSDNTKYSIAIQEISAPIIFGSLSSIGIINGGSNFKIGDILPIQGSGKGALGKVTSIRNENGKVAFSLVNGGFGFSTNAVVTVTGGGGSGASFKVGSISNKQIFQINTDIINDYYNTQLDASGSGFNLNIDTSTGDMSVGESVTSSANVVGFDVQNISGIISPGDVLYNTSLGISNLRVYYSDGSLIRVTGTDSNITNANLVNGVTLTNGTDFVIINTVFPKTTINGTGTVVTANSSVIYIDNVTGYYVPGYTVTGATSGKSANVVSVDRLTNWEFPNAVDISNLDGPSIGTTLHVYDLEVGSIDYLTAINPGIGYASSPAVDVVEPLIYGLRIADGMGGFYGHNAEVTSKAGVANGVATSVQVVDAGFGYSPEETLTINSADGVSSITGAAILNLNGVSQGYWKDSQGFSSDLVYLQDSNYYQIFSYEIIAKRMLNTYKQMVLDLVHPSGIALFGRFVNYNEIKTEAAQPVSFSLNQS